MKYIILSYFLCGLQAVFMAVTWDKFINKRSLNIKEDIKLLLIMVATGYLSLISVIILIALQLIDWEED